MSVNTTSFELIVTMSHDPRLVAAIQELVRCALTTAGINGPAAESFGRQVEALVRASLREVGAAPLPVTFRTREGAVVVLVAGETLTVQI